MKLCLLAMICGICLSSCKTSQKNNESGVKANPTTHPEFSFNLESQYLDRNSSGTAERTFVTAALSDSGGQLSDHYVVVQSTGFDTWQACVGILDESSISFGVPMGGGGFVNSGVRIIMKQPECNIKSLFTGDAGTGGRAPSITNNKGATYPLVFEQSYAAKGNLYGKDTAFDKAVVAAVRRYRPNLF